MTQQGSQSELHGNRLLALIYFGFCYSRYLVDEFHNVVLSNYSKKRHHESFKKDIPLSYIQQSVIS